MSNRVVAVVVTYNRKELLCECLDALFAQTLPVEKIVLVNNASTDGTEDLMREKGYLERPQIDYVLQPTNIGGAGGFYEGLKRARDVWGFDWAWLMDDDTIPTSTALEEFMKGASRLRELAPQMKIGFLSGIINDGAGRANNSPVLSAARDNPWYQFLQEGFVRIKSASFVSFLVPFAAVRRCGLPSWKHFIWGDDVEYSLRLGRNYGEGYLVGAAKIVHKQKESPNIYQMESIGRIKMLRHPSRNWLIRTRYYDGRKRMFLVLFRSLIEAILCLRTKYGFLKFRMKMAGTIEAFTRYAEFKQYFDSQISGEQP